MTDPSPDAVLETLDSGSLVDALILMADSMDIQAERLCHEADHAVKGLGKERALVIKRLVGECIKTRYVIEENRKMLRVFREILNQSGVVHVTPEGIRRALIGVLGWCLLAFAGLGLFVAGG